MSRQGDTPAESSGFRRRDVLVRLGAGGGLASVAGCQGLLTQTKRYVAEPAVLDAEAGALGYTLDGARKLETKREESVSGATLKMTLVSHVAGYDGPETSFGTAATPRVEEAGQVLNPVATAALSDLVSGDVGGQYLSGTPLGDRSWRRGPFREDSRTATLLGTETTVETYAGITDDGDLALVSIARVDDDGDAVIAGGGRSWALDESTDSKAALQGVSNDRRFTDHVSKIIDTMPHVIRKPARKLDTQTGTPTTGLVGVQTALGSDVDRTRQALYFVQGGGKLRRYDLVREVKRSLASGTVTIQGTYSFDFDTGTGGGGSSGQAQGSERDVWWRIRDGTTRWLVPENGAEIAYLGNVSYGDVAPESLPSYDYTSDHLEVTKGGSKLTADTVVAVKSSDGNYAKAEVVRRGPNRELELRFETYELTPALQTIGTGYTEPEDVQLRGDGRTAYVTERGGGGALLEVTLGSADRSSATVVASGFGTPHQVAIDRTKDLAHVVTDSKVVRVDLGTGNTTTVYDGLQQGRGIVVDDSTTFAYVTEQVGPSSPGALSRIELGSGRRQELYGDVSQPFHLAWANETEDAVVYADRARDSVWQFDLVDETTSGVVVDAPSKPASVVLATEDTGYIFAESVIEEFDVAGGLFAPSGPLFKGIGHIPISDISQAPSVPRAQAGYATTQGAAYPLTTKDAPFGGTLPLKLNHHGAYTDENARYYRVFVDGDVEQRPWRALEWSASNGTFESTKVTPAADGYFEVRAPGSIWFRTDLGYRLPTGDLSNGLHELTVAFYRSKSASSKVAETTVQFRVDNEQPDASLGRIFHELGSGREEVVDACAIVDRATDEFAFEVTAHDEQQHLRAWRLRAVWGHGKSDVVARESHGSNGSGTDWAGPVNQRTPGGSYWTAKKRECAHTFYLHAWGRATNGHHYIHRDGDHKSLTLLLP